ncbi:MAG: DUF6166 domain-containing protein [Gammaproteobacteria bacterium]
MKKYCGQRTIDGIVVTVDGEPLEPGFDIKVFDEKGFEWSYEGTAPQQLALAILADHLGDKSEALRLCRGFMKTTVLGFDNDWTLGSNEIDVALTKISAPAN